MPDYSWILKPKGGKQIDITDEVLAYDTGAFGTNYKHDKGQYTLKNPRGFIMIDASARWQIGSKFALTAEQFASPIRISFGEYGKIPLMSGLVDIRPADILHPGSKD